MPIAVAHIMHYAKGIEISYGYHKSREDVIA